MSDDDCMWNIALILAALAACASKDKLGSQAAGTAELDALRTDVAHLRADVDKLGTSRAMGCDVNDGYCFSSWRDGCPGEMKCEKRRNVACAGHGSNRICYRNLDVCKAKVAATPDGVYRDDPFCVEVDLFQEEPEYPRVWHCVDDASADCVAGNDVQQCLVRAERT